MGEALTRFGAQILQERRGENLSMGNGGTGGGSQRAVSGAAPHRPAVLTAQPPLPSRPASPPRGSRSAAASAVRHPPARGRKRSGTGGGAPRGGGAAQRRAENNARGRCGSGERLSRLSRPGAGRGRPAVPAGPGGGGLILSVRFQETRSRGEAPRNGWDASQQLRKQQEGIF